MNLALAVLVVLLLMSPVVIQADTLQTVDLSISLSTNPSLSAGLASSWCENGCAYMTSTGANTETISSTFEFDRSAQNIVPGSVQSTSAGSLGTGFDLTGFGRESQQYVAGYQTPIPDSFQYWFTLSDPAGDKEMFHLTNQVLLSGTFQSFFDVSTLGGFGGYTATSSSVTGGVLDNLNVDPATYGAYPVDWQPPTWAVPGATDPPSISADPTTLVDPVPVNTPEPSSLVLLGSGLLMITLWRFVRKTSVSRTAQIPAVVSGKLS